MSPRRVIPRLAACVVTYRRPDRLRALFAALDRQEPARPGLRVVVVDNDPAGSARAPCEATRHETSLQVEYHREPRPGIAHARNAAIAAVLGRAEFVVFVDDDGLPEPRWLAELLAVQERAEADVVSGAVVPRHDAPPPRWLAGRELHARRRHATGAVVDRAFTGNVLARASIFESVRPHFDPRLALTGGEDSLYFQRVSRAGHRIVWADEAVVHECIPPDRATLGWYLRRRLRVGSSSAYIAATLHGPWGRCGAATKGLAWAGLGLLQLPRAVAGPAGAVPGLACLAYGLGACLGVFGWRYPEYRRAG